MRLGGNWSVQLEGFRNSLNQTLNPDNIFVFSNQGVDVAPIFSGLNQWSAFVRISKQHRWGGEMPTVAEAENLSARTVPLRGSIEGVVAEVSMEGRRAARAVPVTLDNGATEFTDAGGRFRFQDILEGEHQVRLSATELPAWYDPGDPLEVKVVVEPRRAARADLSVTQLTSIEGSVKGSDGTELDGILIRLLPGSRYTTTDSEGKFAFHNLREGDYQAALDEKTLPEYAVLTTPRQMLASPRRDKPSGLPAFQFEIHTPEKPVRKIEIAPDEPAAPPLNPPAARIRKEEGAQTTAFVVRLEP
jgi:hypothetical protein